MIVNKIIDEILKSKNMKQAQEAIWKSFLGKKCINKCGSSLKVAILNAPCNGFGDIIFAQKIAKYLKDWYDVQIKIFTTLPEAHIKLGENPNNLVEAIEIKNKQCRTFNRLNFGPYSKEYFHLYFIAPLAADFLPDKNQIIRKFKYANKFNVFFFSEYNAPYSSKYDFPTGIGSKNLGLLLVKPPKTERLSELYNPYAVIYIASEDNIPRARACYKGFIELIISKYYKKYKKLDIVVPEWISKDLSNNNSLDKFLDIVLHYYPHVIIKDKNQEQHLDYSSSIKTNVNNILTIRGDILPVNNIKMFSLIKYSIKDILVTGDQSLTDVLSCCSNKNIYYQIAPWKESLGKQLSKELPNKYLSSKKTSCGTLHSIKYDSNYSNFLKQWNFKKLAKPKLNAIMLSTIEIKKNTQIEQILELINTSRKLKNLKQKINQIFEK